MELLLNDIEKALDAELFSIALQSTLTLPDICAALMSPNGKTSGKKYISWYDTYAKDSSQCALSGSDCYYFRCSCIHQGSSMHQNGTYRRVLFIPPHPGQSFFGHNNIIDDCLQIDVRFFCESIINAVRKWTSLVNDNPIYKSNLKNLLRLYPNGLSPYITGCPVIA